MTTMTGINIQFPISRLILTGQKTVETRTYPLPEQYLGKPMAIIETPGPTGNFESRIVGTVIFSKCFKYASEIEFYNDQARHFVTPDSPWKWTPQKPKWGWEISMVKALETPKRPPKKKGIVYTKDIRV